MRPAEALNPARDPTAGPPAFHLLAKPTGATCNLDCEYCFFLSKEMLYPGSRFRMADELLEQYIRQLIEAHRIPHVTIAWQGGEPTMMGVDFFRRSIEYVEKYRRPGNDGRVHDPDERHAHRRRAGGLLQGARLPGRDQHRRAAARCTTPTASTRAASRPSSGSCAGSERLQAARRRVQRADHAAPRQRRPSASRSTASCATSAAPRFMQFIPIIERLPAPRVDVPLAELGLAPGLAQEAPWKSWRDRPLYRQEGSLVTDRSVTAEQYGAVPHRRLRGVGPPRHRRGLRPDVRRRAGQLVRRAAVAVHPLRDLRHRAGAGAQRRPVLVRPLRRGGATSSATSPRRRWRSWWRPSSSARSGSPSATRLPRYCRECDVRFACHGGCPKDRFIETPDGEPGLNYLCAGYKAFFHHVDRPMRMMSDLLRAGPSAVRARRPGTRPRTRASGPRSPGRAATIPARAAAGARSSTVTAPAPDGLTRGRRGASGGTLL